MSVFLITINGIDSRIKHGCLFGNKYDSMSKKFRIK